MTRIARAAGFALLILSILALEPSAPAAAVTAAGGRNAAQPNTLGPSRIDPRRIDLDMSVDALDMSRIRLLRTAILVRHCAEPWEGPLREEFKSYLLEHCGISYDWEEHGNSTRSPRTAPTPQETAFLQRLLARETTLRVGQARLEGDAVRYDPRAIVNREQFASLPDSVFRVLLDRGFVVAPGRHEQIFHVYEQNDYAMIPNFVTVDGLLHLYHLYFDCALRTIEQERLLPAVGELSRRLSRHFLTRLAQNRDPGLERSLRTACLYFTVAAALVEPDSARSTPTLPDAAMADAFQAQLSLIREAAETRLGPVLGTVDYTMFRPRGHYLRNDALTRYFRAMMWFGQPGFLLDDSVMPSECALLVAGALREDPAATTLYDRIYIPTRYFVGPTDDITPSLVQAVADSICGPEATGDRWLSQGEAIRRELIRRDPTRIRADFPDDRGKPQMRFMGMRYTPDSEILQRLTANFARPVPMGLDVFAVMQVPAALQVLHETPIHWDGYWPEVDELQARFGDFASAGRENHVYGKWIRLLRTLNQPAPPGAALFMRTAPWRFKTLQTSLASWAQLRHDTILYAKQSYGAECGGGETPPHLVGYVEPRPDVYAALRELQVDTRAVLDSAGMPVSRLKEAGSQLDDLLAFLERVSRAEVAGDTLSTDDFEAIRIIGATMENLTRQLLVDDRGGYDEAFEGTNRLLATVADVHTRQGGEGGSYALEEGVGFADELLALVEIKGYLYITRGAVLSYHEFEKQLPGRLTDAEWQQMLLDGKAPPRPAWTRRFLLDRPLGSPPSRYHYSSGC